MEIKDFYQRMERMFAEVEAIAVSLGVDVATSESAKVITVARLAEMMGVSRATLYASPWRMPNFGEGEKRWSRSEVDAWLAIPEKERKAEWKNRSLT